MPLASGIGVGDREDDRDIGGRARGDELLRAVEDPAIAVAHRAGPDRGGVGAGLGLGQTEAGEHLSLGHRHQEPPFLLLRAVAQHRHNADRVMHAEDRRDRAVAGSDLLKRQRIADMVGPGPAIFRRHQHAHEAEFPEFGERLLRKPRLAVPFGRMRHQLVAGEFAGRVAQQDLLVGQSHPVTSATRSWLNRWFYAR